MALQDCAGAKVSHRTNRTVFSQLGSFQRTGGLDKAVVADGTTVDHGPCFDGAMMADAGLTTKVHIGIDGGICSDFDIEINVGGCRIDKRYSTKHMLLIDPLAHDGRGFSELNAVVDPHAFAGIFEQAGTHPVTGLLGQGDDVGQVIFPLGIIVADLMEKLKNQRCFKGIDAGVDLLQSLFAGIGIFFFNNTFNFIGPADDSSITGGIIHGCRKNSNCCL